MSSGGTTNYYRTPTSPAHPEGRLMMSSSGMSRGMILDERSGRWHGVSGVEVSPEGTLDAPHLTPISEDEAKLFEKGCLFSRKVDSGS